MQRHSRVPDALLLCTSCRQPCPYLSIRLCIPCPAASLSICVIVQYQACAQWPSCFAPLASYVAVVVDIEYMLLGSLLPVDQTALVSPALVYRAGEAMYPEVSMSYEVYDMYLVCLFVYREAPRADTKYKHAGRWYDKHTRHWDPEGTRTQGGRRGGVIGDGMVGRRANTILDTWVWRRVSLTYSSPVLSHIWSMSWVRIPVHALG